MTIDVHRKGRHVPNVGGIFRWDVILTQTAWVVSTQGGLQFATPPPKVTRCLMPPYNSISVAPSWLPPGVIRPFRPSLRHWAQSNDLSPAYLCSRPTCKNLLVASDVKSWDSVLPRDSLETVFGCLGLGVGTVVSVKWASESDNPVVWLERYEIHCCHKSWVFRCWRKIQHADQEYLAICPLIARLFCIPATSAPVERVFSQGGL